MLFFRLPDAVRGEYCQVEGVYDSSKLERFATHRQHIS